MHHISEMRTTSKLLEVAVQLSGLGELDLADYRDALAHHNIKSGPPSALPLLLSSSLPPTWLLRSGRSSNPRLAVSRVDLQAAAMFMHESPVVKLPARRLANARSVRRFPFISGACPFFPLTLDPPPPGTEITECSDEFLLLHCDLPLCVVRTSPACPRHLTRNSFWLQF